MSPRGRATEEAYDAGRGGPRHGGVHRRAAYRRRLLRLSRVRDNPRGVPAAQPLPDGPSDGGGRQLASNKRPPGAPHGKALTVPMADVVYIALAVLFCILAIAYARVA